MVFKFIQLHYAGWNNSAHPSWIRRADATYVAVLSHAEYDPTLTAAAALRVKAALSKAAWWPWPFDLASGVRVTCQGHQAALFTAALTREGGAAVTVITYWAWETTVSLRLLGGARGAGAPTEEERGGAYCVATRTACLLNYAVKRAGTRRFHIAT